MADDWLTPRQHSSFDSKSSINQLGHGNQCDSADVRTFRTAAVRGLLRAVKKLPDASAALGSDRAADEHRPPLLQARPVVSALPWDGCASRAIGNLDAIGPAQRGGQAARG
jgi:hypothetical protein